MARVGADGEAEALAKPYASRCMGAGRLMAGFILVEPPGVATDEGLKDWLERVLAYVEQLPPKTAKRSKPWPRTTTVSFLGERQ